MIRAAIQSDIPEILKLTKMFYDSTDYPKTAPYDPDTVALRTARIISNGILLVSEKEGKLVGLIAILGAPFFFNDTVTTGHEVAWWVLPEERKSGEGWELFLQAEKIRKLRGWKSLQMFRLPSSPPALDKLFIAEGFLPSEFGYTKVD